MQKIYGKRKAKKVLQYDLNGNFIKEWESGTEVERQLKIDQGHISECCNGKRKKTGGFVWKFKEV